MLRKLFAQVDQPMQIRERDELNDNNGYCVVFLQPILVFVPR